jgi:hypothetical protein
MIEQASLEEYEYRVVNGGLEGRIYNTIGHAKSAYKQAGKPQHRWTSGRTALYYPYPNARIERRKVVRENWEGLE